MPNPLSPPPWLQFIDPNGMPYAGGKLYTYLAGTTTPATTYLNSTGTPNSNPIILDAYGICVIYFPGGGSYKYVLTDKYDVPVRTQDNISTATAIGLMMADERTLEDRVAMLEAKTRWLPVVSDPTRGVRAMNAPEHPGDPIPPEES